MDAYSHFWTKQKWEIEQTMKKRLTSWKSRIGKSANKIHFMLSLVVNISTMLGGECFLSIPVQILIIDQTKQTISIRFAEHSTYIKKNQGYRSAIVSHALHNATNPSIVWKSYSRLVVWILGSNHFFFTSGDRHFSREINLKTKTDQNLIMQHNVEENIFNQSYHWLDLSKLWYKELYSVSFWLSNKKFSMNSLKRILTKIKSYTFIISYVQWVKIVQVSWR